MGPLYGEVGQPPPPPGLPPRSARRSARRGSSGLSNNAIDQERVVYQPEYQQYSQISAPLPSRGGSSRHQVPALALGDGNACSPRLALSKSAQSDERGLSVGLRRCLGPGKGPETGSLQRTAPSQGTQGASRMMRMEAVPRTPPRARDHQAALSTPGSSMTMKRSRATAAACALLGCSGGAGA